MDFENLHPGRLVGQRDLYLPVQPAGSQQRRVQHVGAVGRHDHFDLPQLFEAVKLVQKLHERALDLSVGEVAFGQAAAADRVDFVHEYDAGLVVPSVVFGRN